MCLELKCAYSRHNSLESFCRVPTLQVTVVSHVAERYKNVVYQHFCSDTKKQRHGELVNKVLFLKVVFLIFLWLKIISCYSMETTMKSVE